MLTQDDINAARESLRFNSAPRYATLYAALAAYSRVATLLVAHEASQRQCPEDAPAAESWLGWTAKLRRALEGK